jgi:hypothetical protein
MFRTREFEGKKLFLFLAITFGWSWLLWLPSVIVSITDNQSLMFRCFPARHPTCSTGWCLA